MHPALCQVRDTEFPMVREYTYLNTASQGPWPTRTVQAVQEAATAMAYVNTPRGMPESAPAAAQARERLARLLHAASARAIKAIMPPRRSMITRSRCRESPSPTKL